MEVFKREKRWWGTRRIIAWALGQIGDERAVGLLEEALNDPMNDKITTEIASALEEITGKDYRRYYRKR